MDNFINLLFSKNTLKLKRSHQHSKNVYIIQISTCDVNNVVRISVNIRLLKHLNVQLTRQQFGFPKKEKVITTKRH